MTPILQTTLPHNPLAPKKLPGIQPLDMADWLRPDEAFAAQMAERARLLDTARGDVLALDAAAMPAAQELLETVLQQLYPGAGGSVLRPDGQRVAVDRADPMGTLARLTQADLCILEKPGDASEHVLTGAALCFPASWKLSEKFMRPLTGIHVPVASYDENIAARVQRLFDGVQPGRPLWRFNALWYRSPELHQPRSQYDRRDKSHDDSAGYIRSEKQMILRLPQTRAVVFAIHTYVVARADVMRQWGSEAAAG